MKKITLVLALLAAPAWGQDPYSIFNVHIDTLAELQAIVNATIVQGTGAANQVAFFSDADTLTSDPDFYFDGAFSLGLGTTSPNRRLDIYTNDASASALLQLSQDGTGDAVLEWELVGVRAWVLGIDNSDDDKFKLSPTTGLGGGPVLTVLTTGEVGIGTVSPAVDLHVVGDFRVSLGVRFASLVNCALDTDAQGDVICGTDDDIPESGDFGNAAELNADGSVTTTHSGSAHHSIFVPNADPGVDHSGYVAGHGDGTNAPVNQCIRGVDASGNYQDAWTPVRQTGSVASNRVAIWDSDRAIKNLTGSGTPTIKSLTADGALTAGTGLTVGGTVDINGTGAHDVEGSIDFDRIFFEADPTDVGTALDVCRATSGGNFEIGDCASLEAFKRVDGALAGDYALRLALRINARYFTWLDSGWPTLGLVAEELASVHPALANWSDSRPVQPNRNGLHAVWAASIQVLVARIDELENRIAELEAAHPAAEDGL